MFLGLQIGECRAAQQGFAHCGRRASRLGRLGRLHLQLRSCLGPLYPVFQIPLAAMGYSDAMFCPLKRFPVWGPGGSFCFLGHLTDSSPKVRQGVPKCGEVWQGDQKPPTATR